MRYSCENLVCGFIGYFKFGSWIMSIPPGWRVLDASHSICYWSSTCSRSDKAMAMLTALLAMDKDLASATTKQRFPLSLQLGKSLMSAPMDAAILLIGFVSYSFPHPRLSTIRRLLLTNMGRVSWKTSLVYFLGSSVAMLLCFC